MVDFFTGLIASFGYFGVFLVSLISSASIIFPVPGFAVIFTLGSVLNPFLVGLSAGLCAAFGELSGYFIGYGGEKLPLFKKYQKKLDQIEKLFQKYHGSVVLLVFSALPLPFDVVGIFCGTIEYPVKKFLLFTIIGKVMKYLVIAYAGDLGISFIIDFFRVTG